MSLLRPDRRHPLNKSALHLVNVFHEVGLVDPQTRLPNRRSWDSQVEIVAKSREPITLLVVDANKFKQINDTHGHQEGDMAIIAVANILKEALREEDFIARIGGDEFGVLMPNTEVPDPEEFIIEIKRRIKEAAANFNEKSGKKYDIGLAVGGVFSKGPTHNMTELFKEADESMYQDKNSLTDL